MTTKDTYTIDASGRTLGRVASEAAKMLMGKTRADYVPHIRSDVKVAISNASKLRINEQKRTHKMYQRYSGYPGGQKNLSLTSVATRKGYREVLRHAIERMLPKNTMRVGRLKNLTITE